MHNLYEPVSAIMRACSETVILKHFQNLSAGQIEEKAPNDLVTVADKESERFLTRKLGELLPEAAILGEEATAADPSVMERIHAPLCWVIDPIDGTGNFARGESPFGILIALVRGGETEAGWIYDPVTKRLCHANRSQGAWINDVPVTSKGSGQARPVAALYTSFMDASERQRVDAAGAAHYDVVPPPMCAAEQYPLLVTGKHDVTIYRRSLPWDHAAGALFLGEAGGKIARFDGTPYRPDQTEMSGMLAAATPGLWDAAAAALL